MKLAMDVQYTDQQAHVCGVLFDRWDDKAEHRIYTVVVDNPEPYVPGKFYLRELPCLLALFAQVREPVDCFVVDGYCDVGPGHPGLGRHLYDATRIPCVGVAKTQFQGACCVEVLRGDESTKPLFCTQVGGSEDLTLAIKSMHGSYRIPRLLKLADSVARESARASTLKK